VRDRLPGSPLPDRAFTRAKRKHAIRSGFADWRFAMQRTAKA
jgi:hypothetical protein